MATEQRLIDANELKEKMQEHHDFFVEGVGGFRYLTPKDKARVDEITNCIAEIINAPTVDAVEVVRCRECKHSGVNEKHPNKPLLCYMTKKCGTTDPNWFCADGERRTAP